MSPLTENTHTNIVGGAKLDENTEREREKKKEIVKDKTMSLIDWTGCCKVRDRMMDGAVDGKALKGKVTPGLAPSA